MLAKRDYFRIVQENKHIAQHHDRLGRSLYAPTASFNFSAPFGAVADLSADVWSPLLAAIPDLERRTDILMAGRFNAGDWFASTGYFVGHFEAPLWGIAPTKRPIGLRYGWFDRVEGDKVVESYVIFDVARLMIEAGQWPLAPQLGNSWSPAPETQDGIALRAANPAESDKSLKLVEAMIAGLMQYDRQSLSSMGMVQFWTPQFQWYGPGGIGSARGHRDYERAHQGPFLGTFPDRVGGNHKCRIGEGTYVASTGWPSIKATHMGHGWLGLPATNKPITMRVMDFWRREGDLLAENWVFIDMIDLLQQIGVDVFGRMQALNGENLR
jgi:predicted ester cyclase